MDSSQILHSDKDHQVPFMGGPNAHHKSKIADGCHLEKLPYLRNSLTDHHEIWLGDSLTLLTLMTVKNSKFKKFKMAAATIVKN